MTNTEATYTSITGKFQSLLDSQKLGVKGLYLGAARVGIVGTTRRCAKAAALIGRIYTVDSITDLGHGKTAVSFNVPDMETATARFDAATA